jgi:drug/metabolite transporter (DMT)-like permease
VLIGTISSVTVAAEYFSFLNLPLGDATVLILGTTPVFTGIMGFILLKEKWPLSEVMAALVSIGGVVCVARPTFLFGHISIPQHKNSTAGNWEVDIPHDPTLRNLAVITALAGAFTTALGFLAVRKASSGVHSMTVLVYSSVIGGTGAAVYLCATDGLILPCSHPGARWLLLGVGVAGFMGQVTGTKAVQLQSASTVALVRYLDVPLSFAYELLFFRGELNVFSLIGAIIILIAATTAGLFQLRQEKKEARQFCPYALSKRPFI